MSFTVHLAGAHVCSRRSKRRCAVALPARWPSSITILSGHLRRSRRLDASPEGARRPLQHCVGLVSRPPSASTPSD